MFVLHVVHRRGATAMVTGRTRAGGGRVGGGRGGGTAGKRGQTPASGRVVGPLDNFFKARQDDRATLSGSASASLPLLYQSEPPKTKQPPVWATEARRHGGTTNRL